MASHGVKPDGPHFVRYRRIDMPHRLDVEVCVPVAEPIEFAGDVLVGTLPAGRYAALVHTGPVEGLIEANEMVQKWLKGRQLSCAVEQEGSASIWGARTEVSLTGVTGAESALNFRRRRTEIAYLLN